MKKFLVMAIAMLSTLLLCASAHANITTLFDYENVGSTAALGTYMTSLLGQTVDPGDTAWEDATGTHASVTFISDSIFNAGGGSSEIDFDTANRNVSNFKLVSVEFDWAVFDETTGVDFGFDVFDDVTNGWHNNIYSKTGVANLTQGSSGPLSFDDTWEVTRIRFHDSGVSDVGMDNLKVVDNRVDPAPEPATMTLLGVGLFGLLARRKK